MNATKKLRTIRIWISVFIVFLVFSGITAFPLLTEIHFLTTHSTLLPDSILVWLHHIESGLKETSEKYPFMAYGTDWLAFAHLVIAVAFIGPFNDPLKNSWVIQFGMIACVMVFPLAFICGAVRSIPFFWQLIDCSFGAIGFVPLYICYKKIMRLQAENNVASPSFPN